MGSCFSAEKAGALSLDRLSPHPALDYPRRGIRGRNQGQGLSTTEREKTLHRIPGRLFLNGSTGVASLYTQQGKKGTNQDAMIVWEGPYLVIGNVGDSRAVLATRDKDNSLTAVQLTVDLKPNLPAEAERIRNCKGRVFALHDEPTVARVWLPKKDAPGLAMARAFGDFCLKDFGLISVPEISYRHLSEEDEFVVLATDGVWDVLSNKEVVDIVASAPAPSSAARTLVHSAVRAWRYKYPTSKVDDCAVVCLFLDSNSSNLSHASSARAKVLPTSMDHINNESEKDDRLGVLTSLDRSGTVRTGENEDSSKAISRKRIQNQE
ncbi:hypothetical protein GQ457_08G014060 [Hibiscus cannabinus]